MNIHNISTAPHARYSAFVGSRCIASGELTLVARKAKEVYEADQWVSVSIFDDHTGESIEVDFRGTADEVAARAAGSNAPGARSASPEQSPPSGPGRPRLGVIAREVTLLPRHWDWLNRQPGGASVALRKLVEEARRTNSGADRVRQSQEACYRFMSAAAGDLPGFEEAARALFAGSASRFGEVTQPWPTDIRDYARRLAQDALDVPGRERPVCEGERPPG